MKRTGYVLALLLIVSLATGCFRPSDRTYSLEVTWNEAHGYVVLPDNLEEIESGTMIELKAMPQEGWHLAEWKGQGITEAMADQNPLSIVVNRNMKIEAVFAEIIYATDFEGEDLDGWEGRGDPIVEQNEEYANSGKSSMKVLPSEEENAWNGGVWINLFDVVEPGETYVFSGWAYHTSDQPKQLTMQLQYDEDVGAEEPNTEYKWLHNIDVSGGTWTKFKGEYTVPEALVNDVFWLYWEVTSGETHIFYLDDILVLKSN